MPYKEGDVVSGELYLGKGQYYQGQVLIVANTDGELGSRPHGVGSIYKFGNKSLVAGDSEVKKNITDKLFLEGDVLHKNEVFNNGSLVTETKERIITWKCNDEKNQDVTIMLTGQFKEAIPCGKVTVNIGAKSLGRKTFENGVCKELGITISVTSQNGIEICIHQEGNEQIFDKITSNLSTKIQLTESTSVTTFIGTMKETGMPTTFSTTATATHST